MLIRRTTRATRRGSFTASSLLACLLLLLTLPFVGDVQSPAAPIPICCQMHGKHQCSLHLHRAATQEQGTSASSPTVQEKCPYNPAAPAGSNTSITALPPPATLAISLQASSAPTAARPPTPHATLDTSNPKRGPPSLRSVL